MKKYNLKDFDPEKIADLDLKMWKAYYEHKFFKLFILLIKLNHQFFKINHLSTVRAAYYSASAATLFRISRGKENIEKIRRKLVEFFKLVSESSKIEFDYTKAAGSELNWWLVDRYPERYDTTREEALAQAMAVIFNVDVSRLSEFAAFRAKAMALRDEARLEGKETDWQNMGLLLRKSFDSLHHNVQ